MTRKTATKSATRTPRMRTIAMALLTTLAGLGVLPAAAQSVEYAGALVDRSEIPQLRAQAQSFATKGDIVAPAMASFGDHWSSWTFGPCDATSRTSTNPFNALSCERNRADNNPGVAWIGYPVHLPHGSVAQFVYYWYSDTNAASNPSAGLWTSDNHGDYTLIASMSPTTLYSGGDTSFSSPSFSHTVDNWNYNYNVLMILDRNGAGEHMFYRGIVFYKLQVAPAPASATFNDVPTSHPFFRFVEALADAGTTGGCGGGNYCPDAPVTRGQMAVFLSQVLGLNVPADVTP